MYDVDGCFACDLIAGRQPLPGGRIHRTRHCIVEHCGGRQGESPLGIGTLLVKPQRHVVHVADLHDDETAELGPASRRGACRDEADEPAARTAPHSKFRCLPCNHASTSRRSKRSPTPPVIPPVVAQELYAPPRRRFLVASTGDSAGDSARASSAVSSTHSASGAAVLDLKECTRVASRPTAALWRRTASAEASLVACVQSRSIGTSSSESNWRVVRPARSSSK